MTFALKYKNIQNCPFRYIFDNNIFGKNSVFESKLNVN